MAGVTYITDPDKFKVIYAKGTGQKNKKNRLSANTSNLIFLLNRLLYASSYKIYIY